MVRPEPATIGTVVARWAADHPDRPAIVYLPDGETEAVRLSYGELDRRARGIAAELRREGLAGQRALLSHEHPVEFVAALCGCLYAGVLAVPVSSGGAGPAGHRERLAAVARDCRPAGWLVDAARDQSTGPGDPPARALRTDLVAPAPATGEPPGPPAADQPAILQYTSGTTADPRGVLVTHANVLANVRAMDQRGGHPRGETAVTWLPLYHDMGLFGSLLHTLYAGGRCVLMPPMAFLRRPVRWLRAIEHYRGYVSGGPDFGYQLCVRRTTPTERAGLDLSGWRIAFNGAEPVRAATIEQFCEAFAAAGFRRRAILPLYGLAEATLMVTGPGRDAGPSVHELSAGQLGEGRLAPARAGDRVARLVSCGQPVPGTEVEIVDERSGRPVPAGQVGEIWLRGSSVAAGYWQRPAETAELFGAELAGRDGRYLRTGDLGGLVGGELVVTGRRKDLIIVRGVNHYPQDLEESARRAVAELRPGAGAAFPVAAGERDDLVLVQELPARPGTDPAAAGQRIADRVAADHGVALDRLVLVRPGQVPTTSSGKVQRSRCRELLAAGRLRTVHDRRLREPVGDGPEPAGGPAVAELAGLVEQLLDRPAGAVGPDQPLTGLGLDSLAGAELQEQLRQRYGVEVDFVQLLAGATVADLAGLVGATATGPGPADPGPDAAPEADPGSDAAPEADPGPDPAPAAGPEPDPGSEPFPLTDLQQAYLVGRGEGLPLGGVGTHSYLEFRHREPDLPRLLASWRALVDRHPMLRAVLTRDGRQRVLPPGSFDPLVVDDLRGSDRPADRLAATRGRMERQVHDPYTAPVYEIRISLLPGGEARIHLSFDLLILDAPSLLQVLREWGEDYSGGATRAAPAGPSFAEFQRARAGRPGPDPAELRRRAEQLPPGPGLPLAADPATLGVPSFRRRRAELPRGVLDRLRAAARRRGVTLSALVGAAYAEVLAAYAEPRRFSLNVTSFERPAGQVGRQVVGEFTSLLLVPVEPPAGTPFEQRVGQFAGALLDQLRQRDLAGIPLVRERARTGATAGAAPAPLAPVVFTSLLEDAEVVDWLGELVQAGSQTPQVWLDHQLYVHRGGLVLVWDAVDALFPAGLLDDMLAGYQRLLRSLADRDDWSAPGRDLIGLPGLDRALPPATVPARPERLDRLVHAQAGRTPAADAVLAPDRRLSYQELSGAARQLAGALVAAGVAHQELVAVVLEPGWQQAPAVLGVLTAGAAYVPVDPEVPAARLAALLRDSGVRRVVTSRALAAGRDWPDGVATTAVEDLWPDGPDPAAPDPPGRPDRSAGDLAYVIYTSGSTGAPKGVAVTHGAAANTVADINERFGVSGADRVLAVTPLTFDLSVYDLFGPLSVGGALVVPEPARRSRPDHWVELLGAERVTIWNSVPALLRMLWEDPAAGDRDWAHRLRLVLLSGDWIPVPLAAELRRELPAVRLVSLGGATEAAIWSVLYEIDKVDESWPSIPYGRAMRGQAAVVLDDCLAPRPVWAAGPLYLAGAGLARGYLHDPDRTRERFPVDPVTGTRLYRTGDLARLRPDGELELLGREDDQIKVQGHRIEPGEVEEALRRHPAVREVVVGAVGPRDGSRRLVAQVRLRPGARGTVDELRQHAGRVLPRHLVPDLIRLVDQLPLTRNGKVDRRALFATGPPPAEAEPLAPDPELDRDPAVERRVREVVSRFVPELAGGRPAELAPDSRLADLGLTSMELIQLGAALDQEFGHRPDLATLYQIPDLAGLAAYYRRDRPAAPDQHQDRSSAPDGDLNRDRTVAADPAPTVLTDPEQRAAFKRREQPVTGDGVVVGLPDRPAHPAVAARRSARGFGPGQLPVATIARWLGCLRRHPVDGETRRGYGSAGGLYPVQVYLQVHGDRVAGLGSGVYQYDPAGHRLVLRTDRSLVGTAHHWPENQRLHDASACAVFLVADLDRITPLYGELAEQFCYLEAGAIGQLLATTAAELDLAACPIGFLDFQSAAAELALTTPHPHRLVHSLLAGPPPEPGPDPVPAEPAPPAEVPTELPVDRLRGDTGLRLPRPRAADRPAGPAAVLVTGATGFLGRHLVAELLARTGAVVYGLATSTGPEHARDRIVAGLAADGIALDPDRQDRLVGLPGDLAAPWLGLRLARYEQLAGELDLVVHAGAGVNWLRAYPDLRPVNVTGTRRVLELAAAGRATRLVHVSTVAVFPFDRPGPVAETAPLDHGGSLLGGYPQSKWVAERLVAAAAAQRLDTVVIRPGTITGHSGSGGFNQRSFFEAFLATVLATGWAPTGTGEGEVLVDLAPVDYVAAATAVLALRARPAPAYHLVNPAPLPLAQLYRQLAELGYRLRCEPYPQWRRRVLDPAVVAGTGLAPFAGYLAAAEERFLRMPRFDPANAQRDLAGTGVACPAPDRALLSHYLAALHRAGLLPAPPPAIPH